MKTLIALALAAFPLLASSKESIKPGKIETIATNGYVTNAFWHITDQNPVTILTSTDVTGPRWFVVQNTNPLSMKTVVTLKVDDQDITFPLWGSAVVYGKTVRISQSAQGGGAIGMWSTVSLEALLGMPILWNINSPVSDRTLVALFDTDRDFLLSIDGNCTSAKIVVLVDGKPIDTKPGDPARVSYEFISPSAVIGRGKAVHVLTKGQCAPTTNLGGALILLSQ